MRLIVESVIIFAVIPALYGLFLFKTGVKVGEVAYAKRYAV